ncbi:unnamed protein product [Adineta ricciae]|uniref:CCDC113/CCDC96 coiled-coil domain-containing protein n=1 Tax=Adineta ricciae TaxID=249248 RepID=A0A814AZH9_ADIRI|nr:unnamed protein product [Adineta ricciae]CAF1015492.1 unnamed protein product [Adineta ricciae]
MVACLLIYKVKPHFQQILKTKTKQPLAIEAKRQIAESSCKVLQVYNQKHGLNITHYIDEYITTVETVDETIDHLEGEMSTLKKFMQKIQVELIEPQKRFTTEELFEFFHERMHYLEALNERKRQKTVRLRFNIDGVEQSIRKARQIVDMITEVDFEQLKIDIDKQLKEMSRKNRMLVFYKRQQSEANVKLNAKKPELFKELRALVSIRKETNLRIQLIKHYNELEQKLQHEIHQYEITNKSIHQLSKTYRLPSIVNYVDLKSKQTNLHNTLHIWQRKVQIAEHELELRRIESHRYPEQIFHPWKYLQNPSSLLMYQHYHSPSTRTNDQEFLPKLDTRSSARIST